jgi:hypothetical protein
MWAACASCARRPDHARPCHRHRDGRVADLSGALAAFYGIATGRPLFIAFSTIGVLNGEASWRTGCGGPTVHMHWWLSHMGNMLGA